MTQAQQPEALRLANALWNGAHTSANIVAAVELIRTQHARIAELEKAESQLIAQRDHCEEVIDRMADAVLGKDRREWSSAYDFMDAAADVDDRMGALEAAPATQAVKHATQHATPPAEPAPQAQDVQRDAGRWREVIRHVGAAYHLDGQHYTLNRLPTPEIAVGFRANLMQGSVAEHFARSIDAAIAARAENATVGMVADQQILNALSTTEPRTASEIATLIALSPQRNLSHIRSRLLTLRDDGAVRKVGGGKPPRWLKTEALS